MALVEAPLKAAGSNGGLGCWNEVRWQSGDRRRHSSRLISISIYDMDLI